MKKTGIILVLVMAGIMISIFVYVELSNKGEYTKSTQREYREETEKIESSLRGYSKSEGYHYIPMQEIKGSRQPESISYIALEEREWEEYEETGQQPENYIMVGCTLKTEEETGELTGEISTYASLLVNKETAKESLKAIDKNAATFCSVCEAAGIKTEDAKKIREEIKRKSGRIIESGDLGEYEIAGLTLSYVGSTMSAESAYGSYISILSAEQ